MRYLLLVFFLITLLQSRGFSQSVFELNSQQSMCMVGKGQGQDATINPYADKKSIAVIRNLGNTEFSARVQSKGKIIKEVVIPKNQKKEILLEKGYELYLDSEDAGKAKLTFKKSKN